MSFSKTIKISVIIPVYNAENFINASYKSVKDQEFVNEIIFINDSSTDNSSLILNQISEKDNKVKVIHNKNNYGAGKTRNIGIKASKNDWISFLDVDDYYLPRRFVKAVKMIDNNSEIDGVYESVENIFINKEQEKIFDSFKNDNIYTIKKELHCDELFANLLKGDVGFVHLNGFLVKKKIIEKVGYFDDELKLSQDTDLFFKISSISNLYPGDLKNPVAHRQVHASNRVFKSEKRLKYYSSLKFFKLKKWALEKQLSSNKLKAIDKKLITICSNEILKINIYKFYKLKFSIVSLIYKPLIIIQLKILKKYA